MSGLKFTLKDDDIKNVREICVSFNHDSEKLLSILSKVQKLFGFLPPEVQNLVAAELKIQISEVLDTINFYSFLTAKAKARHPISICTGNACLARGADNILEAFKNELNLDVDKLSEDGEFSLIYSRCIGACGLAPVVMIDEEMYGNLTDKDIPSILRKYNTTD